MRLRTPRAAGLAIGFALLSCGGDDAAGPDPEAFTIAVAPGAVSVLSGSTKATQVTVTRLSGFTGDVKLTAENLPPGIEVVLPPTLSVSRPTAPMYVVAGAGVSGTRTFTVRAKAPGKADKTAELSVTVAGESPRQYGLTLSASAITIQRGLTGSVALSISREPGFTTAVPFECGNVPDGVHLYPLNPAGELDNPVAGYSAQVIISVSLTAFPTTTFLKCYGLVDDVAVEDVELRLVVVSQPLLAPPAAGKN